MGHETGPLSVKFLASSVADTIRSNASAVRQLVQSVQRAVPKDAGTCIHPYTVRELGLSGLWHPTSAKQL